MRAFFMMSGQARVKAWGPRGAHLLNPPSSGVVELAKATAEEGITEETT